MVLEKFFHKFKNKKVVQKNTDSHVTYFNDFKKFRERFFNNNYHSWIKENPNIVRSFDLLFDLLTLEEVHQIFIKGHVVFLRGNGKISCSLPSLPNTHFIIVFPELYKLLKSASPLHSVAIIAHELGHIINEHTKRNTHPIIAQFEADEFVCKLGLKKELIDVLNDYKEIEECEVRIKKLEVGI